MNNNAAKIVGVIALVAVIGVGAYAIGKSGTQSGQSATVLSGVESGNTPERSVSRGIVITPVGSDANSYNIGNTGSIGVFNALYTVTNNTANAIFIPDQIYNPSSGGGVAIGIESSPNVATAAHAGATTITPADTITINGNNVPGSMVNGMLVLPSGGQMDLDIGITTGLIGMNTGTVKAGLTKIGYATSSAGTTFTPTSVLTYWTNSLNL